MAETLCNESCFDEILSSAREHAFLRAVLSISTIIAVTLFGIWIGSKALLSKVFVRSSILGSCFRSQVKQLQRFLETLCLTCRVRYMFNGPAIIFDAYKRVSTLERHWVEKRALTVFRVQESPLSFRRHQTAMS